MREHLEQNRPSIKVYYSENHSQSSLGDVDVYFFDEAENQIIYQDLNPSDNDALNKGFDIFVSDVLIGRISRAPREGHAGCYKETFVPAQGIDVQALNTSDNPDLYPMILIKRGETKTKVIEVLMETKEVLTGKNSGLESLMNAVNQKLLLDQLINEPEYFMKLMAMDQARLALEAKRLIEETRHYKAASGEELDWHWSPASKREASKNLERLRLVEAFQKKFNDILLIRQTFELPEN